MTKLSGWKLAYAVSLFCVWTAIAANAQTSELPNRTLSPGSGERGRQSATAGNKHIAPRFTNLANFEWNNGLFPSTSLIQSRDGKAFGVTPAGGNSEFGSIFEITPGGGLTSLHSFYDDVNGGGPSDLIQVNNGDFYGTTASGGANLGGTVFKLSREGTLTTLYNFCDQPNCIDGEDPRAPLVQGIDGDFYGTTYFGGDNGYGTVFRITPAGSLTTLHSFNFSTDGQGSTGLVQASNGTFYGTTEYGGPNSGGNDLCYLGCGTTFAMTSDGTFTTLYDFCGQPTCEDGYHPYGGLMQALDGNLYGTAVGGGNPSCKSPYGCGTVFKITPSGSLTTIHRFNDTDGANPYGSLIEAIDGNLYGTTAAGGFENRGLSSGSHRMAR